MRFAPGGAVPGDRIVGIMTPGEAITIYPIEISRHLAGFENTPERWLDVGAAGHLATARGAFLRGSPSNR